eukprot:Anaeramoba_ignava/a229035_22.p1 GENE.a229035_22~~a229035_22.p1  ORF type:complete len:155 (+),score=14.52 a229035_22:49-465(+)
MFITPTAFSSGNNEEQTMAPVQEEMTTTQNEPAVKAEYHKIDAQTAKNAFDTQDDITIVDVRTQNEYYSGHVQDAINIPLSIVESAVVEQFPDKNAKLYLYCRSGNRSSQAARILVNLGYTNIYDFGGIIDWPYEVVK